MPPEVISNILDNHSAPQWLTKNYVTNIMKNYSKDMTLKILNMSIERAIPRGENYASIMTRVRLEYSVSNGEIKLKKNLIIKSSFEDDEFAIEKMKEYQVCQREMDIYQQIVPKLNEYLKEINDDEILFATVIHVDYENSGIIFDDLLEKCFKSADRINRLNENEVKIVLRKMAKLHATSAVYDERCPGFLDKFDKGFYNKYTNKYSTYFVNTLKVCGERIIEYGDDFKIYSEKISKLLPFVMDYGRRTFEPDPNTFNCFNHGDLWSTNIMFHHNSNKEADEAVLIDFQYSHYSSPCLDLHYFFSTSLQDDLQLNKQEEFLNYYYFILVRTLTALNYKKRIPTLFEIWIDFIRTNFFAVTSTCVNLAIAINEDTRDADFHSLMGVDERAWNFKRRAFDNPIIQKILKNFIPKFDKLGLLDID